ncbi:MAG: hypothetical protein NC231_01410 [Bacillus sp. (in: Bacteria)]|nr:hypothetical protein [Bacillus sp. (in: firmicutes)]MCM1425436.1 hypothetical protein [Eubacterium sp.]
MEKIGQLYRKYCSYIEDGLFVIILAFYPLIKINQGLDVADTSYSLANFQYFPSAKGTWMAATYLANVVGWLMMQLPKGNTLIGMYFYTGLLVSFTALLFYFVLRKKMPAWLVFAGEILALSLCWAPTTGLYHYLTYLMMGAGILLLYQGICTEKEKTRICLLFLAGICLGANVAVRMPNIVQAAFILALWYGAWLQKEKLQQAFRETLVCIIGYLLGFGIPFLSICIQYGVDAYPKMVYSLFAMTDKAQDYKPDAMLTGMFGEYGKGLYWLIFALVCIGGMYVLYFIKQKVAPQKGKAVYFLLCIAVCCVLVRFYWGRGMFDFRYYAAYTSMYQWAVLFLLVTIGCAAAVLVSKKRRMEDKVLALLVLLQIFLTPLGGNNKLYPIINNLFLAAPFTLCICFGYFLRTWKKEVHIPWKSMALVLGLMLFIQSIGFHTQFVFLDGVWGEKRDTLLTAIPKVKGIYTNKENAELFTDLTAYAKQQDFAGRKVILYGEVPGLSYFLDMPTAISTSWPDLDSYRMTQFEEDMRAVEQNMQKERPVVITASAIAAYRGEDAEAYAWFGVDEKAYDEDEKLQVLLQFLEDYGYEETFCNMRYAVYE